MAAGVGVGATLPFPTPFLNTSIGCTLSPFSETFYGLGDTKVAGFVLHRNDQAPLWFAVKAGRGWRRG